MERGIDGADGADPAPTRLANGRIDLAHCAPFQLGSLRVDPGQRQVVGPAGGETLEPRVMQVLVALVQAHGNILSRNDLFESCWDGRVVGENAIHRVISRLRHLAAGIGAEAFRIETITKVGYRLAVTGIALPQKQASPVELPNPLLAAIDRRALIGVAAAAGSVAVGFALWKGLDADQPSEAARMLYRKGVEIQGDGMPDRAAQATAYFLEATRIEPGYAAAWGALALSYRNLVELGPTDEIGSLTARSRSAAKRALELDRGNPDARAALLLLTPFYRNWATVETGARDILRQHPRHIFMRATLGWLMSEVGRWQEAILTLGDVNTRDGFLPLARYRLIIVLWSAGRLQDAENAIDAAFSRWPRHSAIWQTKFKFLCHTGRPAAAIALANDRFARPPDYSEANFEPTLATARALLDGRPVSADAAVAINLERTRQDPRSVPTALQNCAALGRVDPAFALLEGYYLARGPWAHAGPSGTDTRRYTIFLFNPLTASLRRDGRFAPLLQTIGLEDYWRSSRSVPDFRR